jgi:hypothetical protein
MTHFKQTLKTALLTILIVSGGTAARRPNYNPTNRRPVAAKASL